VRTPQAPFRVLLIASDPSIKAALQPVEVFECICEGACDLVGRFVVQPVCVD
jgi:hypothetical protein